MTIDIQTGDTFTTSPTRVFQNRNGKCRFIMPNEVSQWADPTLFKLKPVCANAAIAWIRDGLGHTITETTPPPTPVPWPTHAAYHAISGAIVAAGTEAQCQKYVEPLVGTFCIRPLAPAPPSSAMRSFIEAFEVYSNRVMRHTDTPGSIENLLLTACRNLLAEGGAQ